ncbi:MAG: PfkB family carbohydrate kinase [Candidatus Puniceispirillaceae bacterium]
MSDKHKTQPKNGRVTVIGGVNVDIYGRAAAASSEQGMRADSYPGVTSIQAGGVARNISENLARLGMDVSFIGCFGSDPFTRMLRASLEEAGVDISLAATSDAENDRYLSLFDADGQLVAGVNSMYLAEDISPAFLKECQPAIEASEILIIEGNLVPEAISYLASLNGPRQLVADTVSAVKAGRFATCLNQIDILKCNQMEAATITGLPEHTDPSTLCKALLDKGVGRVLLSAGDAGFLLADTAEILQIDAKPVADIATTSGAGDALLAGYIYAIQAGLAPEQAADMARDISALTLICEPAVNPDIKSLLNI